MRGHPSAAMSSESTETTSACTSACGLWTARVHASRSHQRRARSRHLERQGQARRRPRPCTGSGSTRWATQARIRRPCVRGGRPTHRLPFYAPRRRPTAPLVTRTRCGSPVPHTPSCGPVSCSPGAASRGLSWSVCRALTNMNSKLCVVQSIRIFNVRDASLAQSAS